MNRRRRWRRWLIRAIVAFLGSRDIRIAGSVAAGCVAAWYACDVLAVRARACEPFQIRVRLRIDHSIAAGPIAARLKDEADAIWRPYGIRLEWVDADSSEPAASGVSLDVTVERRFAGADGLEGPAIAGRTYVLPVGANWRPIRVSFDAIENVIAGRTGAPASGAAVVRNLELGRALGRVLAHEIGHVLIDVPGHDRTGLMRPMFYAEQLADADRSAFRLACGAVDRLRHRLGVLNGGSTFDTLVDSRACVAVGP